MFDLEDGRYTVLVDLIEDGLATVFFGRDGESLSGDAIEATALPEAAQEADAILHVTVEDGECTDWVFDPELTEERVEACTESVRSASTATALGGEAKMGEGDEY